MSSNSDSVDAILPPFYLKPCSDTLENSGPASFLHLIFIVVYANPKWKNKLNPAFLKYEHCDEIVQKGGSLLQKMSECAKIGKWDSLFSHRESIARLFSTRSPMTCKKVTSWQCVQLPENFRRSLVSNTSLRLFITYSNFIP